MTQVYQPTSPVAAQSIRQWARETDVLVVGLGAAGASAAIEAATAGAEVEVLELASAGGGTTALAGGQIYLGGGTPIQKACGFEDSAEAMYEYLLMAAGPNADHAKVRAYVDDSLAHYDWLVAHGVEFNPVYYPHKDTNTPNDESLIYSGNEECHGYRDRAAPVPRGHKPKAMGEDGGATLMRALIADLEARPGVTLTCDARVLTLILDGRRVVGAMARIDGEVVAIRAHRGVVLCAGGFIFNDTMIDQHAPRLKVINTPLGNPGDDGTGIRLGLGAGGAAINMHEGFMCLPFYPPASHVKGIMVNGQGQRFVNEDCYHGQMAHHAVNQPNGKVYLLVDESLYQQPPDYAGIVVKEVGDSIEELERDAGFAEGTLASTLAVYNTFAARGEDPLFHKQASYLQVLKPPFVLLDCSLQAGGCMYSGFTFGGLNTRVTGEVLDHGGQPVPGLYAAGRNTAGLPRSGEGYSSGMSIGDATYFGRRAGQSAASHKPQAL